MVSTCPAMQSLGRAEPRTPSTFTAPSTPAQGRRRVDSPTSAMSCSQTSTTALSSPDTLGTATSRSRKYSLRSLSFMRSFAFPRIVPISETIAQDVGGENGQPDEQAREEADPECVPHEIARLREHVAPRRRRRGRTHPEEGQGRLVEDGVPEDEGRLHDELRGGIGQDVP